MSRLTDTGALLAAQLRVGVGLAAALDPPVLGAGIRGAVGAPEVAELEVGGVAATLYRPARGRGPWPAVVAFPGVTRQGRRHPAFVGLGRALASVGCLALVPEPRGIAFGELTGETVADALAAGRGIAESPKAASGAVALVGVSGGATLALCVAGAATLAGRVTTVLGLAPVCDLREALRFVTTGHQRRNGRLALFQTRDFFRLVCARSLVAALPAGAAREDLVARLRSLPDYGGQPLEKLRTWSTEVFDEGARATVELLLNRDPGRFDELLAALPEEVQSSLAALSAVAAAPAIEAPVELVVARRDKYVPFEDAAALVAACPSARLTVLDSLEHVVPRLSPRNVRDLARLDAALVRMLAASYSRS